VLVDDIRAQLSSVDLISSALVLIAKLRYPRLTVFHSALLFASSRSVLLVRLPDCGSGG
jgi:hypothetical protein